MTAPFYMALYGLRSGCSADGVAGAGEGRDDPAQVVAPAIPHTDALPRPNFSMFMKVVKNLTESF